MKTNVQDLFTFITFIQIFHFDKKKKRNNLMFIKTKLDLKIFSKFIQEPFKLKIKAKYLEQFREIQ